MLTREILQRAADVVRGGWCRDTRYDEKGRVCALGALEVAASGKRRWTATWVGAEEICPSAVLALAEAIAARTEDVYDATYWIAKWNNAADQTAENVALAFELAATLVDRRLAPEKKVARVDRQPDPDVAVPQPATR